MPATTKGIYHNLKESNYTVSNTEIVFFFSSEKYLDKFLSGYKEYRELFRKRFIRMCGMTELCTDALADIKYYDEVEKRGFRATVKGSDVEWHDVQKYGLREMTRKNTLDWSRIQKPKLPERVKHITGMTSVD